jgi:hypothetical protein
MLSLKFLCKKQKILKTRPSKSKRIFTRSYLRNNAIIYWFSGEESAVRQIAVVVKDCLPRLEPKTTLLPRAPTRKLSSEATPAEIASASVSANALSRQKSPGKVAKEPISSPAVQPKRTKKTSNQVPLKQTEQEKATAGEIAAKQDKREANKLLKNSQAGYTPAMQNTNVVYAKELAKLALERQARVAAG